jgi:hypothetical protein
MKASALAADAADAADRGDLEEALRLQQTADALSRRARRIGQRQTRKPTIADRGPTGRQRAITALTELGVPSSPKQIVAYVMARTGEPFDVRALASVRRDERRSWNSGSRRDTYVVPTLEGPFLVPGRGRFALSHWPLSQRIVGPLSPRVDHLRACRNLVEQSDRLRALDPDAAKRLRGLIVGYARSVPGALEQAWSTDAEIDTDRVLSAVGDELELIGDEDQRSRRQQAERAEGQLDEEQQLWGADAPQILKSKND